MRLCVPQLFFLFATIFLPEIRTCFADQGVGKTYSLSFDDIYGKHLSTNDNHVSIVVLVTQATWPKAQAVGDRVPDEYIGDPAHRFITVVNFGHHSGPVRAILAAGARARLNAEAKRIQPRYDARKITHDPRQDIFAVADFDGVLVTGLGVQPDTNFHVFVFGRTGELLGQWNDVPNREELTAVLK